MQQTASREQQAASSKQQAASSKQQAASSKQRAESGKHCRRLSAAREWRPDSERALVARPAGLELALVVERLFVLGHSPSAFPFRSFCAAATCWLSKAPQLHNSTAPQLPVSDHCPLAALWPARQLQRPNAEERGAQGGWRELASCGRLMGARVLLLSGFQWALLLLLVRL